MTPCIKNSIKYLCFFALASASLYGMEQPQRFFNKKKGKKLEPLLKQSKRAALNNLLQKSPTEIQKELMLLPIELREALADSVNNSTDNAGNRLLHRANSSVQVERLLTLGALHSTRNIRGETPLLSLLKALRLKEAITLLKKCPDIDVNHHDNDGETPLAIAQQLYDPTIKNMLLERGAQESFSVVNSVKDFLRRSTKQKGLEQETSHAYLKYFMEQATVQESKDYYDSCDPSIQKKIQKAVNDPLTYEGLCYLHLAKTAKEVEKLLFIKADYSKLTNKHENPLHYMIKLGRIKAAQKLLKNIHDDHVQAACNVADIYNMTPLFSAVKIGDLLLIRSLIKKGANLDYHFETNNGIITVFHLLAPHATGAEMIDYIFKKNGNRRLPISRLFIMCAAIEHNNPYLLYKLMPKGKTFDALTLINGHNLFTLAVTDKKFECAEKLLRAQVKIYDPEKRQNVPITMHVSNFLQPTNDGKTPLMHAAQCGTYILVKLLLDKGAKVNETDNDGTTALMFAAQNNEYPAIVQLLLHHGEDVNARNNRGCTPLHFAAFYNNFGAAKFLVFYGADVLAEDNENRIPSKFVHKPDAKKPRIYNYLVNEAQQADQARLIEKFSGKK